MGIGRYTTYIDVKTHNLKKETATRVYHNFKIVISRYQYNLTGSDDSLYHIEKLWADVKIICVRWGVTPPKII